MNEELQVGLGLKIDKFQEGLKSASRDVDSFSTKLKGPIAAITGIGSALAGIGIVNQIQSISEYAEKIRNLSEGLNVGTTELQKWFNAVSYSGVSAETATKSLTKFTMKLNSAASGAGQEAEAFANLGITIANSEGKIRPTMEILGDVSDMFATMPDKSERSRIAVELFGKQGLKMVSALSMGRAEMERLGEIKQVISPEALETLDKMGDDIAEVFNSLKGSGASAISVLAPYVEFWKASFFGLKEGAVMAADSLYALFNFETTSFTQRLKDFAKILVPDSSNGLKTDKQRKDASEAQYRAIQSFAKASKEQAAFEKEALKIRMESASASEKVALLEDKSREQSEKVADLKKKGRTDAKDALKAIEAETALLSINADLEKARQSEFDQATKKRIQAYTDEAEAQERINKLSETAIDLTRTLAEMKEKSTKTTVKEMAQQQVTRFDSPERRKAIETAKQIADIEQQQEQARREGRSKDAAKLQEEALKLRSTLSADIFQRAEIKPFASIEEKLAEANEEKARLEHIRRMDRELEEDAKRSEAETKRRAILEVGGEKVQGPGLFLGEDARKEFAALAEKSAHEMTVAGDRVMEEVEIAAKKIPSVPSTPETEAAFAASLLSDFEKSVQRDVQAASLIEVPSAPSTPETEAMFQQMLDNAAIMDSVGSAVSSFKSENIEEILERILQRYDQPLKIKPVNGP